jgi:hypothetical protein
MEKDLKDFHKRSKDKYRYNCIDCIRESSRQYYKKNKEEILSKQKSEKRKSYNKEYYELNKDKKKKYYEENKHNIVINKENKKEWSRKYYHMKKETDSMFIFKQSIRGLIRKSLNKNGKKTSEILGCSFDAVSYTHLTLPTSP